MNQSGYGFRLRNNGNGNNNKLIYNLTAISEFQPIETRLMDKFTAIFIFVRVRRSKTVSRLAHRLHVLRLLL